MINSLRPDIVAAHLQVETRMLDALAARCAFPGMPWAWPWRTGCELLAAWGGEMEPLPTLDRRDGERVAAIVGFAGKDAVEILTYPDVSLDNGVWHFAVVSAGQGGMTTGIRPQDVVTRVRTGGNWLGLMPNAPDAISVRRLPGNLPWVSWVYSTIGQQAAPASFGVYACSEGGAFDFGSPIGTVNFVSRQTRYEWTGAALSAGDVRYYTVRAISAGGVKGLIPRIGRPPSASYTSVELARCARLDVPAASKAATPAPPVAEACA